MAAAWYANVYLKKFRELVRKQSVLLYSLAHAKHTERLCLAFEIFVIIQHSCLQHQIVWMRLVFAVYDLCNHWLNVYTRWCRQDSNTPGDQLTEGLETHWTRTTLPAQARAHPLGQRSQLRQTKHFHRRGH